MKFVISKTVVGGRHSDRVTSDDFQHYVARLQRRRVLQSGGLYRDRGGSLMLIEAKSLEEAIAVAREDPRVEAGLENYEVQGLIPFDGPDSAAAGGNGQTTGSKIPAPRELAAPPPPLISARARPLTDRGNTVYLAEGKPELMLPNGGCPATSCGASASPATRDARLSMMTLPGRGRGRCRVLLEREGQVVGHVDLARGGHSRLPIFGEHLAVIECLWVDLEHRGSGGGKLLLNYCIEHLTASGIAVIGFNRRLPDLDRSYFEANGFSMVDEMDTGRFHDEDPVVARLLWRKTVDDAAPPRWQRADLCSNRVPMCPFYPYLGSRQRYYGETFAYHGIIVREGLRRPEVLDQFPRLAEQHRKHWTLIHVGVPRADLQRALSTVQAALCETPSYFAHFFGDSRVLVAFPDRIFEATADPASWREAIDHGRELGIPRDDLIFAPVDAANTPPQWTED